MAPRPFWLRRIEAAWKKRPIVWLAGVRRVGKTTLARMRLGAVFLNCDLPSDVRRLEDPESFFRSLPKDAVVVLDEIHRLADPTQPLKIAADAFRGLRLLATGSSTLAASRKFRDTLTGRKSTVLLPPVLWPECTDVFELPDLDRRLLHGGLPEPLLASEKDPEFFAEWLDSFYARDIQELFGIRERTGFLNLFRLLLAQSGGLADISRLARESGVSRPTAQSHLEALRAACAVSVVPPFHGGGRHEIVRQPRVYGFDTGFVTFARGWDTLRADDRGGLWEHVVLDVLRTAAGAEAVRFWRDKSGREIDFVMPAGRGRVDAFECKINPDRFDPASMKHFRESYPNGRNCLISPAAEKPYDRTVADLQVRVGSCRMILEEIRAPGGSAVRGW